MARRRRPRHTAAEYFLAALGLALIVLFVVIAAAGSCKMRLSPEIGIQPSRTAAPTQH